MQINYQQLSQHLQNKLERIYLIQGDVPLLVQAARDRIRKKAKAAGFLQHELLIMEPKFSWEYFTSLTQNLSLFSEKTLIDLRNPNPKFDSKGLQILLEHVKNPSPDITLIISLPKLTQAQQKAKWYQAISKAGLCIRVWPINAHDLPRWLQQVAQHLKIKIDAAGIKLLAELTEGNLLAAKQALDKLRLRFADAPVGAAEVGAVVNDNARYNVFDLSNSMLTGNAEQSLRILNGLKAEGSEITFVLWAITRELRELIKLTQAKQSGGNINQLLQAQWAARRTLLQQALQRVNLKNLLHCLNQACQTDEMIKGIRPGNPWNHLSDLVLSLANSRFQSQERLSHGY